jgi:hypothetical protein
MNLMRIKKKAKIEAGQGLADLKEVSASLKKEIDKINKHVEGIDSSKEAIQR